MISRYNDVYEKIEILCYNRVPIKFYLFACDVIDMLSRSEIDEIDKSMKKRVNDKFK